MAATNPYATANDKAATGPTTFTHPPILPSSPLILDPNRPVQTSPSLVSDKLYSGFIEHVGRGIYGGIVDDVEEEGKSPEGLLVLQDEGGEGKSAKGRLGWRKDVIDVIGKQGELEMPILRWPGGNFVSNYHWQDGIGPLHLRPKRVELAWLSTECNLFGTDEFIDYARKGLGVEPYLCLNLGTGSMEEALAWLEYCNGTGDTHWANLRRTNTGRNEPHAVKYWGLGNEMHGPWQVGHLSAGDYVKKALKWGHAMKLVDPSIRLISCGNQGNSDWDREVLLGMIGIIDMHSIHFYSMLGHDLATAPGHEFEKNVFGPCAAEVGIKTCRGLIDMAKIERNGSIFEWTARNAKTTERVVKICYDEWNVWDESKAPGASGLEQKYEYVDMLATAAWLNLLVRNHEDLGMACLAQSVNVIAPVMTRPDGLLFQPTYYPLRLFARYMKNGRLLDLGFQSPRYEGPCHPDWIPKLGNPTYVDVVAVLIETEGKASIRVSILNRHPNADWTGKVSLPGFKVTGVDKYSMYSDDMAATNTWEKPDHVKPSTEQIGASDWEAQGSLTVRKHSWTFLIIDGSRTE